jgi:hypothetical protein
MPAYPISEPRLWLHRYAAEALWSSLPTTDSLLQFIAEMNAECRRILAVYRRDGCRMPTEDDPLRALSHDIWYDDDETQPNDRKSMRCIAEMQHG